MTKKQTQIMVEALHELRQYAALKLQQYRLEYPENHAMVQTAIRMRDIADNALIGVK